MAATKSYPVINVPKEKIIPGKEAAVTNSSLQSVLRKRPSADVVFYNVPCDKDNLFLRHTLVLRSLKVDDDAPVDMPDLEDLYDTELPWTGKVSFLNAARQFRAKYSFTVFTSLIKEYDGYLYLITEGVLPNPTHPILIKIDKHPLGDSHSKLTMLNDTNPEVLKVLLAHAKPIPDKLIAELTAIGYVLEGDRFVWYKDGVKCSEILCRIYGKFLAAANGR